jgi:DnaJ-class molecular chaperone
MAQDYYLVLGLARGASPEQIKTAYRRSAKRLHPDTCPEIDTEAFRELTDAYETLSDENKRRAYDASLRPRPPATAARPAPVWRDLTPSVAPCPVVPLDEAPALRRPAAALEVEVRLPWAVARAGGRILLQLPLEVACPQCAGAFREAFGCRLCRGLGAVETTVEVALDIAPGTADGHRCSLVLCRQGLRLDIRFVRTD